MCDMVGHKALARYQSLNDAFRMFHTTMGREDLQELFQNIHMSSSSADRFFDLMDSDGSGILDSLELRGLIGQYIKPGERTPRDPAKSVQAMKLAKAEVNLQQLGEIIGVKAGQKYRNVKDCFRYLDADHDGNITRRECMNFMEVFGFPTSVGAQVFKMLSSESGDSDYIDYNTFLRTFGPYITPGYKGMWKQEKQVPARKMSRAQVELHQLGELIGCKASQKYRNVRDCFRSLDYNHDGTISRGECIQFMETFGLPSSVGERVFSLLGEAGGDEEFIRFTTFVSTFGPYIVPGYNDSWMKGKFTVLQPRVFNTGPPTPPQTPSEGSAPSQPQRPSSAQPLGRQNTPVTARGIPAGEYLPVKVMAMDGSGVKAQKACRPRSAGCSATTASGATSVASYTSGAGPAVPEDVRTKKRQPDPRPPSRPPSRQRPWARRAKTATRSKGGSEELQSAMPATCPHCSMPLIGPRSPGSEDAASQVKDDKLASALEDCWSVL